MTRHPVPDKALKEAVAIIGRIGSGKTYAAKGMVERVLDEQTRVCIIDPTGVWYGLRSSSDGKRAGFPVVIFGGAHADVQIAEESGAALAKTLAVQNLPSIIDLSEFTIGERTRFMTAFLDVLYVQNRASMTFVVDEADMFAPQRPMPDQTIMFSRMEQIVRRGRVRGFVPWLITQRPAELHKSVLSQANTLIAMQLTAPQDRDAVGAWIEGQADRDEGKKILAALPKLKKGEGWVWSPSHDILERVTFPAIRTFDSSRTPEEGETLPAMQLAVVDLSAIEATLVEAQKAIEHDDPTALRKRISELEAELKARPDTATEIDQARTEGREQGRVAGYGEAWDQLVPHVTRIREAVNTIAGAMDDFDAGIASVQAARKQQRGPEDVWPMPKARAGEAFTGQKEQVRALDRKLGGDTSLPKAELALLAAVAQFHPKARSRIQMSILTGYSITSSTFANALGALRSAGYVDGRGDDNTITEKGLKALGSYQRLPTGKALQEWWLSKLPKAERIMLAIALDAYPKPVTKERLAEKSGYSITSSTFANAIGKLRTLELIARGEIRASAEFFQ